MPETFRNEMIALSRGSRKGLAHPSIMAGQHFTIHASRVARLLTRQPRECTDGPLDQIDDEGDGIERDLPGHG